MHLQYASSSPASGVRRATRWCAAFLAALAVTAAPAQTTPVRVGVWAIEGKGAAEEAWGPTLRHLGSSIPSCTFTLVPLSREELAQKVERNALDFVILDPVQYIRFEAGDGVTALASLENRSGTNSYAWSGAAIFSLQKSGLSRIGDLRQKTVASANENSLEDWLAALCAMRQAGLDPAADLSGTLFFENRGDVVDAVLSGRAAAGCIAAGTLESLAADGKLDLSAIRILPPPGAGEGSPLPAAVSTRLYPTWFFAACPKAPHELAREVAAALLTLPGHTVETSERPHRAGWTSPVSTLAVHECLQTLRLPPYEHFGEVSFVAVVRQYMYWFIAAGALLIVMALITAYVTALNRALTAEIVERKRAESALRESVSRFEHIASCSADWIWECDRGGCYTYSSAIVEQMLGYSQTEILGRKHADLLAKAERERLQAIGQISLGDGARVFRERFRLLTKDGRVVIHEITAEPVLDRQGEFAGYRGVNRDITNQVRFVRLRQ